MLWVYEMVGWWAGAWWACGLVYLLDGRGLRYSTVARSAWKPRPVGPSFSLALLEPNCIARFTRFAVSGKPQRLAAARMSNLSPYPGPSEWLHLVHTGRDERYSIKAASRNG